MSILEYYRPTKKAVMAVVVRTNNASAVACEFGGELFEEARPFSPGVLNTFIRIPTLEGITTYKVSDEGFVIGRENGTGKVVTWDSVPEFEAQYSKSSRERAEFKGRSFWNV